MAMPQWPVGLDMNLSQAKLRALPNLSQLARQQILRVIIIFDVSLIQNFGVVHSNRRPIETPPELSYVEFRLIECTM